VADPSVSEVEGGGVTGHDFLHEGSQALWPGTDQEVEVIGHEGPGKDLRRESFVGGFDSGKKIFVIGWPLKDGTALDAAGHDVVQEAGEIKAGLTGHKEKLSN